MHSRSFNLGAGQLGVYLRGGSSLERRFCTGKMFTLFLALFMLQSLGGCFSSSTDLSREIDVDASSDSDAEEPKGDAGDPRDDGPDPGDGDDHGDDDDDGEDDDDGGGEVEPPSACGEIGACTPGVERLNPEGCEYSYRVEECNSLCRWKEKFPCGGGCGEAPQHEHWDEERVCIYRGDTMWGCSPAAEPQSGLKCRETVSPYTQNVRLTKSFWMDRYPVTVRRARKACEELDECLIAEYGLNREEDWPVTQIRLDDEWPGAAQRFCRRMGGVLPTEARWMRAASGDTRTPRAWPWGDGYSCEEGHPLKECEPLPSEEAPDAVNAFPAARSPFGVDALVGIWREATGSLEYQIPWNTGTLIDPVGGYRGRFLAKGFSRYRSGQSFQLPIRSIREYESLTFRCVYEVEE